MRLTESEKANPQDYFLQSGVDGNGDPIHDLLHEFIDAYLPNKAIRKKVFDGNADIVISADMIHIYWKSNLIAETQLEGQVETSPNTWQGQLFSFADANIKKIDYRIDVPIWDLGIGFIVREVCLYEEVNYECLISNNDIEPDVDVEWELYWKQLDPIEKPFYRANEVKTVLGIPNCVIGTDVDWAFKKTKLGFYLDVPGEKVRIRWQARVKDSAVAWTDNTDPNKPIYHKGLSFNVSDYRGAVNHGSMADPEPGWTIHWWTFEPDGKQIDVADARTPLERYEQGVGLVVDPYLGVNEQSTYIDVACDGYLMNFLLDDTNDEHMVVYEPTKTNGYYQDRTQFYDDSLGYNYVLGYDTNLLIEIIENNSLRIKIRIKGQLDRSSGGTTNYLANLDYIEMIYTIYPDRYFIDIIWELSGTITFDTGDWGKLFAVNNGNYLANMANEAGYYENTTEVACSDNTAYDSANHLTLKADEITAMFCVLEMVNFTTSNTDQWHDTNGQINMSVNATLTANTYKIKAVVIVDTDDREGSVKIHNETDRLAMGEQYKDTTMDDPDKGTWVDDLIHPANIGVDGFAADGAWHIEVDSNDEAKFTIDIPRYRLLTVVHDWPFQYGTVASPTSILLNHLKMDDNAANNTLLAEVGPNGTWHAISGGGARNTSNDSVAVDNFRGRALDTQAGTAFGKLAFGNGTVHDEDFLIKGTIILKITPQFVFTTGGYNVVWEISLNDNNRIELYYEPPSDTFGTWQVWGGTGVFTEMNAFTSNYELQRQMVIMISWDSDKDTIVLSLDGMVQAVGINTGTPAGDPAYHIIGVDNNETGDPGDYIYDEIKTFSEAVLPYGAFFIGNGEGLLADIDNPHADLCFFWDCQASGVGAAKGGTDLATDYTVTLSGSTLTSGAALVGTNGLDQGNNATNYANVSVTNGDIFDPASFKMGIWVNLQTLHSAFRYFWGFYGSDTYQMYVGLNTSNQFRFYYESNDVDETIESGLTAQTGIWYWVVATADDSYNHLYINGIEYGTPQAIANPFTVKTAIMAIGNAYQSSGQDCYIGRVFISKDPDTPEIWTAFGKPLHTPLTNKA